MSPLQANAGAGGTPGSCSLLGAAFPHITSLKLARLNPDVQLMSGLAACSWLTKLDLGRTQPTAEMAACAHVLPAWLPHVHTLCFATQGALAVARGLSAQLQHWLIHCGGHPSSDPPGMAAVLATCTQLVSVNVNRLDQALLDTLVALPNLSAWDWTHHQQLIGT